MQVLISEFIDKKPGFSSLSFSEQVKYFSYFYIKMTGDEIFTIQNILSFFDLARLPKPKNIRDILSKNKKTFLPYKNGFVLNREIFNSIELELNLSRRTTATSDIDELGEALGKDFEKEVSELKLAYVQQPNCTAFLMRKILEKAIFKVITKSNIQSNLQDFKKTHNGNLPQLSDLLGWIPQAEINGEHIMSPPTLRAIAGAKFLGDASAHNYLISVSFEDLKSEITPWRIAVKELAKNLS